jgi:hypothetical protein
MARRVSVRTGVCDGQAFGSLPGDEFIAHPMVEWTRGNVIGVLAGNDGADLGHNLARHAGRLSHQTSGLLAADTDKLARPRPCVR